jgi:hypothetical protein
VTYFKDLFGRLSQSWRWVVAQFVGFPILILLFWVWDRLIKEKYVWEVALSLLLPLLLVISVLELQAGTMRSLAGDDGKRVKLVWGAMTLLVWIAVAWVAWALLDWCDDQFYQWASYLNSQAPAHLRARLLTYEHIYLLLYYMEWVCRWIVVPAKVIPYAMASAQWSLRLPWRNALRILWNWRWWLGVTIAALLGVWLPSRIFATMLSGTPRAQVLHELLRLAAAYLLAVGSWVLLLDWGAVLFASQQPLPENEYASELLKRLRQSRRWIWAQISWLLLWILVNWTQTHLPGDNGLLAVLVVLLGALLVVLGIAALVVQAGMMRSLLDDGGKHVKLVWGTLSILIWAAAYLIVAFLLSLWNAPIATWVLGLVVTPAVLIPFATASAQWGLRLPWRRVFRMLGNWRWWLGVLLAALGLALVNLLFTAVFVTQTWIAELKLGLVALLDMGIWVLLLGWFAVLFDHRQQNTFDALALILGQTEPPETGKKESEKPSLPESE